ncbi:hypothetical protein [Clostridium fallax]|uniref:Uncharacterized protein n=1 Tax=Clostridium fallax TaxID=1533 RepID=A0A1M4X863_9CLOT|nr:hypothetical protein [Clostridium fallax]SHE89352.1 hypothetical protein SAMN05443638_11634 [Clostridium fallax]SQB07339.1 Uncharacterised protein [Clostridium fallax]
MAKVIIIEPNISKEENEKNWQNVLGALESIAEEEFHRRAKGIIKNEEEKEESLKSQNLDVTIITKEDKTINITL